MGWNPSDFLVQLEIVNEIQSRSMSDPPLSDIEYKNKMAWIWTTLKFLIEQPDGDIWILKKWLVTRDE